MSSNYKKFNYNNPRFLILKTEKRYNRTLSGKSWRTKPDSEERSIITSEYYTNYVQSIPWFNNFGDGASCRAHYSYNAPGYLPTRIVSISPYQIEKIETTIKFMSIYIMELNAGYREKEIIKLATSFEFKHEDDAEMLYLYGKDFIGIFDTKRNTWRG